MATTVVMGMVGGGVAVPGGGVLVVGNVGVTGGVVGVMVNDTVSVGRIGAILDGAGSEPFNVATVAVGRAAVPVGVMVGVGMVVALMYT